MSLAHRFGRYGGQYVPETLMPALSELEGAWEQAWADEGFRAELAELLRDYAGRPTPLYRARGLSDRSVQFRHALKNTLIPVITIAGLQLRAAL